MWWILAVCVVVGVGIALFVGAKRSGSNGEMEMRVVVPEESFAVVEFVQEEMPGVAVLNESLVEFEPKLVFQWHLSIWMELTDVSDNGMPSQKQMEQVDPFGERLEELLKGSEVDKPNALFLGRLTWNASRELIFRVYDPEVANTTLQEIIASGGHPCEFDFKMEPDPEWQLADWHLRAMRPR